MVGINECECVILFFVCVMFRLWLSTVNTLCHPVEVDSPLENTPYTDEELTKDPLTVLRCDRKIFRCVSLFYHWDFLFWRTTPNLFISTLWTSQ